MTLQARLTFSVSDSLRPLVAHNVQLRPKRAAKVLDAQSMATLDRHYFDQMDAYFKNHFRSSYTFRLDGVHRPEHKDLIRENQPIEKFKSPIAVRSYRGSPYGNEAAKKKHLEAISAHTMPLHTHVVRELGLDVLESQLLMFADKILPATEFHQIAVSEADFEGLKPSFFLSVEDRFLFNHIFGENTVHETECVSNFPGPYISKNLVFTRLPSLSFAISAGHFSNMQLSTRTGLISTWLNPIFVDPEEHPLTDANMLEWHNSGMHPISVSLKDSIRVTDEKGYPSSQSGFITTFRSLISFLRSNLMPDFVKELYTSAHGEIQRLPDDIKALPEVQDLLLTLAKQENSSRMMTLMRIDTPSLLVQNCIEQLLKNTDRVGQLRILRKQTHLSAEELTDRYLKAIQQLQALILPLRGLEEGKRYEFKTLFGRNLVKAQLSAQ